MLAQERGLRSGLGAEVVRIGHDALNVWLASSLHVIIARLARVEVRAAALCVGLATIAPEDCIRRHTRGALGGLGSRLGVRCRPLLALALELLGADPLGRHLCVAAGAASAVLESSRLGIGVDALALVHLVRLELVGALLISDLALHKAGCSLLRGLGGELLHLLIVDEVAPGLAHEGRLVHLLNELSHGVAATNEDVATALDRETGVVTAVTGEGGRNSHFAAGF